MVGDVDRPGLAEGQPDRRIERLESQIVAVAVHPQGAPLRSIR